MAGCSSRTATAGGGWWRRPSRGTSSRSVRSGGCSSTASCSSARGEEAYRRPSCPTRRRPWSGWRRSSTRTSPASCWPARSRPTCSSWRPTSTRCTPTGGRPSNGRWDGCRSTSCGSRPSRPAPWGRRSRRRVASWRRREGGPRSGRSRRSSRSSTAARAPRWWPRDHTDVRNGGDMTAFGVHSEVGRLRKVMVHRPELSLQRLTPTNHDDLLFDDVLWVERAQYEHDQFVAKMRERDVEVFLLQDLLGEALAASDEGRSRLIEVAASEFTVGLSMVDEVRATLAAMAPTQLATHLIGGLTVAESGLDLGKLRSTSVIAAAIDDESLFVLPPLPNTLFTRDSSCWMYGGVSINPMYWPARRLEAYNVAAIYRYHPMFVE